MAMIEEVDGDMVTLLSKEEASQLSKEILLAEPTDYAKGKNIYTTSDNNCDWWLRSPGRDVYCAADVRNTGEIYDFDNVEGKLGVRPAIWINLEP